MKRTIMSVMLVLALCFTNVANAVAVNVSTDENILPSQESTYERLSNVLNDGVISKVAEKQYPTYTLLEYEMNLGGAQTTVEEKIFLDGTNISEFYEHESGLCNEVKVLADGTIYLDGQEVTISSQIVNGNTVSPRVGSMLIATEGPQPGVSYTKYSYTEETRVNLNIEIGQVTMGAFIAAVAYAYPPLALAEIITVAALEIYFAYMKENHAATETAYIKSAVYTTPTIVHPQYQYFKYYHTYYTDATFEESTGGRDITYATLAPTL